MKLLVASLLVLSFPALGQNATQGNPPGSAPASSLTPEEGIPVTDPLVIAKCAGCHTKDARGNLLRISWERTTPEGWEEAIKRMVRLNGLSLTPADARSIVKYLSSRHGLAPEEAKSVMYIAEHRILDETNIPNDQVRGACANCHPFGRPLSWRRSADDWKLLTNLHVALYPTADDAFRRGLSAGGGGVPPPPAPRDGPQPVLPVDEAVAYLAKSAPLHSAEWAAWQARMRAPKLAGRWLISANLPGRGRYYGEMAIEPGSSEDEFITRLKLQSAKDGTILTRSGQGLVYAGYSWRGRSNSSGGAAGNRVPGDPPGQMREVMWFSPDQTQAEGRWFWGDYEEFGLDVKMQRASADPTLIGIDRVALRAPSQSNRVRLLGDNLPSQLTPVDLDFGSGVKVRRIVSQSPAEVVAEIDVEADAVTGKRDVAVRRSVLESAIAVYDRVDYIKVIPESSISRLGSDVHPKGYQQFDAVGYQRGADGKVHTADDVELGPVDVTWSLEEFFAVNGDDDKEFVGKLDAATGLFTPASDGPNPDRKFKRNNYGDVWVVATAKSEKEKNGKPLIGKSYLVVTVPLYIQFDQPEVGQ
jgi:quinohemoprotein amine dehydrogenase